MGMTNPLWKASTYALGALLVLGGCGTEPGGGGSGAGGPGAGGEPGSDPETPVIAACDAVQMDAGPITWVDVQPGQRIERTWIVANPAAEACSLKLEVEGSAFFVDETRLVLPAAGWAQFRVGFEAAALEAAEGTLFVHGTDLLAALPLRGQARTTGCLSVSPGEIRFGIVSPSCDQAVVDIRLQNGCDHAVSFEAVEVLPAGEAQEAPFELLTAPSLPGEVAAGGSFPLQLAWRSEVDGDEILLAIQEDGLTWESPLRAVGLHGPGTHTFIQTQAGEAQATFFRLALPARDVDGDGSFEDDIEVAVDGTQLPPIDAGELSRWYVHDEPAIEFAPDHVPAAGSIVDVTYQSDCSAR